MRIEIEHIGKTIKYKGSTGVFTVEGFEKEGKGLYVYGTSSDSGGGARPNFPAHPEKAYYSIRSEESRSGWDEVEPFSVLPASIETLMKKFGCHEPQTRELVAELIELIGDKK